MFVIMIRQPPVSTLTGTHFPYTTRYRSKAAAPISFIRSCAAARRARRSAAPIGGATAVQRARLASSISVVEHPIVMSFSKAGDVEGRQVDRQIGRASCRERVCQYV